MSEKIKANRIITGIIAVIMLVSTVTIPVFALVDAYHDNTKASVIDIVSITKNGGSRLGFVEQKEIKEKKEVKKADTDAAASNTVSVYSDGSGLVSLGEFKIYHYSGGSRTATGTVPTPGRTVAVDPNVIPLGSVVVINGQEYIAEDTGGSIKGNKIDIYVESDSVAISLGVKYCQVFIKA